MPKRKSPRLKNYDYSRSGYYFITICSHNRKHIFSTVVSHKNSDNKNIVGAIHESPVIKLSKQGEIVDEVINNSPDHLNVKIDKYVIMPNHIHLIMIVEENEESRAIRESPLRIRSVVDTAVGYIKMNVSKRIHTEILQDKVWQRSFHDHIIRGENDYIKIREYIDTNVAKWQEDCFYTE